MFSWRDDVLVKWALLLGAIDEILIVCSTDIFFDLTEGTNVVFLVVVVLLVNLSHIGGLEPITVFHQS